MLKRVLAAVLLLALVSFPAAAGEFKKFKSGAHAFTIRGVISDLNTSGIAAAPEMHGCQSSTLLGDASSVAVLACRVPTGFTWTVKAVSYLVVVALSATENCIAGVSDDASALTAEAWSTTEIGNGTTATCDNTVGVDTDLDAVDEFCRNTDPTGLVVAAGGLVYILVDEESASSCVSLTALSYAIEVVETRVAVP